MPQHRSDAQKAASRANGSKSRGPKSPKDKLACSLSGLKNGALASTLLLPGESASAFFALQSSVFADFRPRNETENTLVQCIIAAQWRLKRLWSIEQVALLKQGAATESTVIVTEDGTWEAPAARTAAAFQAVHGQSGSGSAIHIAETRYQRQLTQALHQFRILRASEPLASQNK